MTPDQKELYTLLVDCDSRFFLKCKNNPRWIPQHRMLIEMARLQPRTFEGILSIQGMQESKAKMFSTKWLNLIWEFVTGHDEAEPEPRGLKRKPPSISSEKPEVRAVPALHTSLSFVMDHTAIDAHVSGENSNDAPMASRVNRTCAENDSVANSTLGQTETTPILIEDSDHAASSKAQVEAQKSSGQQLERQDRTKLKIAKLRGMRRKLLGARGQVQGQSNIARLRELKQKAREERRQQAKAYKLRSGLEDAGRCLKSRRE